MSVFHLGRSETEILGLPRSNEPASKATHRTGISSPIFSVEHLLEQKRKTCDGAFRLREKRRIDFELVKCCLKREERGQSSGPVYWRMDVGTHCQHSVIPSLLSKSRSSLPYMRQKSISIRQLLSKLNKITYTGNSRLF